MASSWRYLGNVSEHFGAVLAFLTIHDRLFFIYSLYLGCRLGALGNWMMVNSQRTTRLLQQFIFLTPPPPTLLPRYAPSKRIDPIRNQGVRGGRIEFGFHYHIGREWTSVYSLFWRWPKYQGLFRAKMPKFQKFMVVQASQGVMDLFAGLPPEKHGLVCHYHNVPIASWCHSGPGLGPRETNCIP